MKIHMSAICGMGMGSLARLLRASGHEVSGSDSGVYPPMSTQLESCGIAIKAGYRAENIEEGTDLVVIGNAVKRNNPEVAETIRRGIRYLSFPRALEDMYIGDKTSVVVAGTHGKTTTSSLVAWILHHAGLDPGFLIGGILRNFDASSRLGEGPHFVVEGDEYDTAFFDKGPKFLHYRPRIGVLTSIEFDHADIFSDLKSAGETFARFISLIPAGGRLIACADDPRVMELCARFPGAPVETYGESAKAVWRLAGYSPTRMGASLVILREGGASVTIQSPLSGRHNALNVTASFAAASHCGVSPDGIAEALSSYRGVKRRQEIRGVVDGIVVIDDFAHHPTEVRETISAIKGRYGESRLWAVWEPRTNSSRRNFFQEEYPGSFPAADRIIIAGVYRLEQIEPERRFSPEKLVADLRERGADALHVESVDDIVGILLRELRRGDVVLVMSNGAFGNIHERVLAGLRERTAARGMN